MSVRICDLEIPRKYGPKVYQYLGGAIQVSVSILGDQLIVKKLLSLEKGDICEFESNTINCIVEIKSVNREKEEVGNKVIHRFKLDLIYRS